MIFLAPRMLDEAVFAEYGWQGGRPLATYNGILLVFIVGWLEAKEDCRGEDVDFMDCFTLDLNLNTSNRRIAGHSCFIIALIYTIFHGFTRISHPTCSLVCIMVEPIDGTQFIGV